MKKLISFLLCLVAASGALFAFTGCGAERVSVVLWHYYTGTQEIALNGFVEEFNQTTGLKKNIVVEAQNQGGIMDLQKALMAAANGDVGAKTLPSMFMTYADTALAIDRLNGLADLGAHFTDKELGQYRSEYLADGKLGKDKLKIFPIAKSVEMLVINKTYFDRFAEEYNVANPASQVGLSDFDTNEGIARLARKYHEATGKALFSRDALDNFFITGLRQQGKEMLVEDSSGKLVSIFDADGKAEIKKFWDHYYVPFVLGDFSHEGKFVTDCMKNGETIAGVGSSASAKYVTDIVMGEDSTETVELVLKAAPIFEGGKNVQTIQGAGISVLKADKATEKGCVEFLKWFTQSERNVRFSGDTGYLPVKNEASDIDKIKEIFKKAEEADPKQKVSQMVVDILDAALKIIDNAEEMYGGQAYEGSDEIRYIFKSNFSSKCKSDATALQALYDEADKIKDEAAKAAALKDADAKKAELISSMSFDAWYETTKATVKALLK